MLKIKELREEKKWQQKDVAEKLNKTTACISSWETGKTEPSIDDLVRLADIFEVSLDYLLGRTDDIGVVSVYNNLSPLQEKTITLFSSLSNEDKYRVLGFIQALLK